jgi:hypothetical protein
MGLGTWADSMLKYYWFWAASINLLLVSQSVADQRIAFSETLGVEVVGIGDPWCKTKLSVALRLKPGSKLLADDSGQKELIGRLRGPIESLCPEAASLTASPEAIDGAILKATGTLTATKGDNWVAKSPAATAQPQSTAAAPTTLANIQTTPAQAMSAPLPMSPQATVPPTDTAEATVHPLDDGYASFILARVAGDRSLSKSPGALHAWAVRKYNKEYRAFSNQEFKLNALLGRVQGEIERFAQSATPNELTTVLTVSFQNYDFSRKVYPLETIRNIQLERGYLTGSINDNDFPANININAEGIEDVAIAMPPAQAEAFLNAHTNRYNNVDRRVWLAIRLRFDPTKRNASTRGYVLPATLLASTIYSDEGLTRVVSNISPLDLDVFRAARASALEEKRKAEEAQRAADERQRMLGQRNVLVDRYSNYHPSLILAAWISDQPFGRETSMSSMSNAVAQATIRSFEDNAKGPVVTMMFKANGSGREAIPSSWPNGLSVTVSQSETPLEASKWYLASGIFSIPSAGDSAYGQLSVQKLYSCKLDACKEASNASAMIDQRLGLSDPTKSDSIKGIQK